MLAGALAQGDLVPADLHFPGVGMRTALQLVADAAAAQGADTDTGDGEADGTEPDRRRALVRAVLSTARGRAAARKGAPPLPEVTDVVVDVYYDVCTLRAFAADGPEPPQEASSVGDGDGVGGSGSGDREAPGPSSGAPLTTVWPVFQEAEEGQLWRFCT